MSSIAGKSRLIAAVLGATAGLAAMPAAMPAIEPRAQVSANRINRFLGLGGGIAWGGFHYHRGPGWTHAQVKRMARKAKNRRRHKLACRRSK